MAGVIANFRLFLFILLVSITIGAKLNVPRVLLPVFNHFSPKYELEVTEAAIGGCFKWSTTRPDIVEVRALDVDNELGCSFRASVSVITKERIRNIAVVIVEDIMTKQLLRCDVVVDVIETLGIITKTKELFMNEAPEGFYVAAYDAQGNEFSSLQGIEFDWEITCLGPKRNFQIVHFMTFKDSPYEAPPGIAELENENRKGYVALLRGIRTGSARISVKLAHEEYMHVDTFDFQISIIANLMISPMDVYILIGDKIPFKIFHMDNGLLEEITFPSIQYYFDVEHSSIAQSNYKTGEITGLQEGRTKVVLHDKNIDESDPNLRLPSAVLNVVTPAYMTLRILPYNNWAVLLGDHHDIVAEVYSSNDHKLYLGPGVKIHMAVEENFHIQQLTTNGSWLTGWARADGTAAVQATLKEVVHKNLGHIKIDPEVNAKNEITVYPRIILTPSEVILPWDEAIRPKYSVPLEASGGEEKFLWSSSDHSIAVVSQVGMVRTHSKGYFEISAAMQKNHYNRQIAKFHILPPSRLEIIEFVMNAEVGQIMYLHIALYAEKPGKDDQIPTHIPFTQCQDLPFKVQTTDYNFIQNKSAKVPPIGIACANIAIVGHEIGTSKIVITYKNQDLHLEDSVTVSTYKTLRLVYPTESEIVLAVGTTLELLYTGGPRPSPNWPNDFRRTVSSAFDEIVGVTDITDPDTVIGSVDDYIAVRVLCKKLGESYVTLTVVNTTPVPNCKNQETLVTVKIICGKPRVVSLQPEIKVADAQSCPMDLSAERVVVQSYNDIELDVIVSDENGKIFYNISSLEFKWTLESSNLGVLGLKNGVYSRYTYLNDYVVGNKSYQIIHPKAQTGTMNITANVIGYLKNKLEMNGIKPEYPPFISYDERDVEIQPISAAITLVLVDDTIVKPNSLYLYNHPANRRRLAVKQGSGFYEISMSEDDLAEVKYLEGSREIEIKPIRDGDLHVNLIDLCLISRPAPIFISVVSVHIIRLEMTDKVEIKKCISCIVRLYDENDNLLDIPDLDMIQLKIKLDREIVLVKRMDEFKQEYKNKTIAEIKYIITGVELGDTKLTFMIGGTDIASAPMDLQVFPPLKLYPRNSTLLLGTVLQIGSKGGPRPDATIEYYTNVKKVAEISPDGLLKGLSIGFTKVYARSVGVNPTTAKKIIYSEDSVNLQVIPINGIKIAAPLTRFRLESTVPVWATGIPEQLTPMILGSANPPFRYDWLVEDSDLIQIHGIFSETSMEYTAENQITMRLTSKQVGRTKLYLNVTIPGAVANSNKKEVIFQSSLDFEIFEPLLVLSPPGVSGIPVLMAPRSTLRLKTNMDSSSKLRYSLPGITNTAGPSEIQPVIISVTEDGLLVSHNILGYAMVLVTATDDQGLIHTLNFIVQVKPLHYMMMNLKTNFRISSKSPQTILPQGTQFELVVSYHDNTGAKFAAGTADIRVRTSRFDLVNVNMGSSNTSFMIFNKKSGLTMLKAWIDGATKTADYVTLKVKQTIVPVLELVTTGDIMCLFTPLKLKSSNQFGEWISSDKNLIRMENDTRIGRVLGSKESHVTLTHSLHPAAPLQIKVVPIDRINMLPYNRPLTNAHGVISELPLVLEGEEMQRKSNLFAGWNCHHVLSRIITSYPYICKFEFTNLTTQVLSHNVFEISPSFNSWTGLYTCDLSPKRENDIFTSTLETNITVWAEAVEGGVVATPLIIPFVPAIYLHNELPINEKTFSADLVITGLTHILNMVTATAFDSNIIYVGQPDRSKKNVLKFNIRLLDYHWKLDELEDPMSVLVVSKLSEQTIKVHIITSGVRRPSCGFFYYYRHLLTVIISMVVIFFITFYAYSTYIHPVINVNIHPKTSTASDHSANQSIRSTPNNQISPFTHSCAAVTYMQRRSGGNPSEPIYGDPNSFYNTTTPELRRNRRFM